MTHTKAWALVGWHLNESPRRGGDDDFPLKMGIDIWNW